MGIISKIFKEYLNGVLYNLNNKRTFYVGPYVFPQWLLALLPFARLFNSAAFVHDSMYAGNTKSKSRLDADKIFLQNCLIAARTRVGFIRPFALAFSYIYFCLVRMYGWLFYKGGGNKW
jgi:hypothetical protein